MYQNRRYEVPLAAPDADSRLEAVKQALIEQGIPSRHQLYLQAPPKYEDLFIGAWPDLYCSDADITLATSVLITW